MIYVGFRQGDLLYPHLSTFKDQGWVEIIDGTMVVDQSNLEFRHCAYCRAVGDCGNFQMSIEDLA